MSCVYVRERGFGWLFDVLGRNNNIPSAFICQDAKIRTKAGCSYWVVVRRGQIQIGTGTWKAPSDDASSPSSTPALTTPIEPRDNMRFVSITSSSSSSSSARFFDIHIWSDYKQPQLLGDVLASLDAEVLKENNSLKEQFAQFDQAIREQRFVRDTTIKTANVSFSQQLQEGHHHLQEIKANNNLCKRNWRI